MLNIITLTGPSGSGKSEILKIMSAIDDDYVILPKYTTRARRKDDDSSIINVDQLPENCDYRYKQYGEEYGFSSQAIYDIIAKGKKPVIIVNDEEVLRKLHSNYSENVKSFFVHRGKPSLAKLIEICNGRGVTDPNVINSRFEVAKNIYKMYTNNIRLFDSIILNIGDLEETHKIVQQVVNNVNSSPERHNISGDKKIYVLSGNSSSGKDFLIRYARKLNCIVVPKHTSRLKNPNDGEEMICDGDPNFDLENCDLTYEKFNGTKYGIEKDRILRNYVFENRNQILTCSDISTIRKLKNIFGKAVVPLYVHSDITPEEYARMESQEGSNGQYIQERMKSFRQEYYDYINNIGLYDRCLVYANDEKELLLQFAGVLGYRPSKNIREQNRGVI